MIGGLGDLAIDLGEGSIAALVDTTALDICCCDLVE